MFVLLYTYIKDFFVFWSNAKDPFKNLVVILISDFAPLIVYVKYMYYFFAIYLKSVSANKGRILADFSYKCLHAVR